MKLVKTTVAERVFTIELTESELGTLVASMGCSSHRQRIDSAKFNEVRALPTADESHELFIGLQSMYRTGTSGGAE